MEREEVLELLRNVGLSEYESKAYVSLVFLGPSKANEISQESSIPQSKIYDVLDQLMNKQLVEVFEGRPKEFKAIAPEVAFKFFLEQKEKEFIDLKDRLNSVAKLLKSIKPKEEVIGGIWSIKGKKWQEFFDKTSEMVERSEKYVYGVTRDYSFSTQLSKVIRSAIKKGVKVRVIGMEKPNEISSYRAKWYKDNGVEVKVFETKIHPRIVLIDGKEILLRLDHNPTKRNKFKFNSIWSNDVSLVKVIDNYVKSLWEKADPLELKKL